MNKYDLSILIPARNEMFLAFTIDNILKNIRGNTEIIVVLDGEWADPPLVSADNLTIIYYHDSIGQRAATNEACRFSNAKYIMKIDAHCMVDEGFDVKMMAAMQDNYTLIPKMYNLHMFDWLCKNGHRIYQGPTPKECKQCGEPMVRDIIGQPRFNRESCFYRFDKTLHFQYWGDFKNRPEAQADIAPTLSIQGSCFMLTRAKYWELDICDEEHGSWGQQGVEVACKTWLSGGQVMVNKKTWYSHMFRTQGGDFGFPYRNPQSQIDHAREYSRDLFINGKWKGIKKGLSLEWLLAKFKPVPDWHTPISKKKKVTKGIVYYSNGLADPNILTACRQQILKGMKEKHIVSVTLQPLLFGLNIVLKETSGYLTMAKQILAGLEASKADVIYFCEHDVLYHPSHFAFIPPREDVIYYNTNVWRVREDGLALFCNNLKQLSGLVAFRETLLKHYRRRVALLEKALKDPKFFGDFNAYVRKMGFEPGTHGRPEKVDSLTSDVYQSEFANLDIRHKDNLTPSRWKKEQFRNKRYTDGWTEKEVREIPGWEKFYQFIVL